MAYAKGSGAKSASYAAGGAVLGRTRDFMKTPDKFRTDKPAEKDYCKDHAGTSPAKRTGDKCLTAVKPRS